MIKKSSLLSIHIADVLHNISEFIFKKNCTFYTRFLKESLQHQKHYCMFTKGYDQFCTTYGLSNALFRETKISNIFKKRIYRQDRDIIMGQLSMQCDSPASAKYGTSNNQKFLFMDQWFIGVFFFFVKCKCPENQNIIHSLNSSFTKHLLLLSMNNLLDIGIKHE